MTENEIMSISGLLDVLNAGISFSTCHIEYAIQTNVLEDLISCLEELEQYHSIGTIDEFKALKEKNEPKKAIFDNEDGWEAYICPSCGKTVGEHQNYCWNCGQAFET